MPSDCRDTISCYTDAPDCEYITIDVETGNICATEGYNLNRPSGCAADGDNDSSAAEIETDCYFTSTVSSTPFP